MHSSVAFTPRRSVIGVRAVRGRTVYATAPRVVVEGDLVALHFILKDRDEGMKVLESSYEKGEPLVFEVGAGEVTGNPLFRAYDEAVRGLAVGDKTTLDAEGGEWDPELLFKVPRTHPEVQRLEGRYKSQGGVVVGSLVELSNGGQALVIEASEEQVVLDANNMLAGKKLTFELEVMAITTGAEIEEMLKVRQQLEAAAAEPAAEEAEAEGKKDA